MPRPAPFPPPLKLHKASGQMRVRWLGRDVYLGRPDDPQLRQRYARLVAELAAGLPAPRAAARTVADVAALWLEGDAPRYGASGELTQFRRALTVLVRLYGDTPARDFKARHLDAVRLAMASGSWMTPEEKAKLAARKGGSAGWCRNVVNRQTVRLRTVWRWAERQGHVPEGAWAHLCTLPGLRAGDGRARATPRRRAAPWADVLAAAKRCSATVRAMLLTMWHSGMRSGEVRTMTRGDVDMEGPVWLYRPRTHKTAHLGQSRVIALGRRCQALLTPFLAAAADDDAPLFRTEAGLPWSRTTYARAVRQAAAKAGVTLQPYQCRHAAKDRITRALGLDAARSALGQKSLGQTNAYGDAVDLAAATEAARRLG